MFRVGLRSNTFLLAASASGGGSSSSSSGGGGGGDDNINNNNNNNSEQQPQQDDSSSASPGGGAVAPTRSTPPLASGVKAGQRGIKNKLPKIISSVDPADQPRGVVYNPRARPYTDYSGENPEGGVIGTDVTVGAAKPHAVEGQRRAPGHIIKPSSVTQTPKPMWMSNIDRKWVAAPIEFGKSTVDTRREWFRVMHYNAMVDKWDLPIRENIRGRRYTHEDAWDRYELEQAEKAGDSAKRDEILLRRKQQREADDSIESSRAKRPNFGAEPGGHLDVGRPEYRGDDAPWQTTPIANVDVADPDNARWHKRGARIADEMLHYDPDILCINELNRTHFQESMWRALRSAGYGSMFVTARSQENRPRLLRHTDPKHPDAIVPYWGSIGNAIFFHKARFTPLWQAGFETPDSVPYLHFCGLRDRVMNLCVWLACIQLTAGDDLASVKARENEAKGVLMAMDGMVRDNVERLTSGVLICGDLNNSYADEPCVTLLRDKFRDAYDCVGGARWTQWYKRDKDLPFGSQRHTEPDYERRNTNDNVMASKETKKTVEELMKQRAVRGGTTSAGAVADAKKKEQQQQQQQQKEADAEKQQQQPKESSSSSSSSSSTELSTVKNMERKEMEHRIRRHLRTNTSPEQIAALSNMQKEIIKTTHDVPVPDTKDDFALKVRDKYGVVKNASDFVWYDDRVFSVLRVLDVPPDSAVMPRLTFEEEEDIEKAVEEAYTKRLERMKAQRAAQGKEVTAEEERNLSKQKRAAADEAKLVAKQFWRPGVDLLPNEQFPSHHVPLVTDVCWNRFSYKDWTHDDFKKKQL